MITSPHQLFLFFLLLASQPVTPLVFQVIIDEMAGKTQQTPKQANPGENPTDDAVRSLNAVLREYALGDEFKSLSDTDAEEEVSRRTARKLARAEVPATSRTRRDSEVFLFTRGSNGPSNGSKVTYS